MALRAQPILLSSVNEPASLPSRLPQALARSHARPQARRSLLPSPLGWRQPGTLSVSFRSRHLRPLSRPTPAAPDNGSTPDATPGEKEEEPHTSSSSSSLSSVEASSSSVDVADDSQAAAAPGTPLERVLQLPLQMASTLSNEDPHYLEKRDRKRWWRSNGVTFPRLPAASLADAQASPPPLSLWQKVLPLGAIFFAASFNLTILHSLKDSIMVTTAGAETLPFLASFVVLPASIGFFLLYGRMVEALPSRSIFYFAVAPLVVFYIFFATVLYPAHVWLHPTGLVEAAASWVPQGLMGLVKVVQYWTFSLFFCMSELWGSVVISVLFWSLANEVCTVSEAKSVYPLIGVVANVALVVSGSFVKLVNRSLAAGSTHAMLLWLVGAIAGMTGVMMLAKAALDKWVIGPYCSLDPTTASKPAPRKKKGGSLGDSLAIIRSSDKIMNLAVLVVSYGVSHRLFEFAWKGALRTLHPTAQGYQNVLADVGIATGYATIASMLLGKFVFQYLGWGAAAAATPMAMFVSGSTFFALSLAAAQGISVGGLTPPQMLVAGVAAGAATQVFARSAKFSLFDPAKEMVYIEMDKDEKSKGKAAVDLLGSQIGKSGGAWITQALLLITGSLSASLPVITFAFVGVVASWLAAVRRLSGQLKAYEEEKKGREEAKKAAKAAAAEAAADEGDGGSSGATVSAQAA